MEGHGDYVMDAVGPQVVPSVAQIRERFNSRRGSSGRIEQTIRRILGIDLKMKQYAEGSRFVRTVVDEVGMAAFEAMQVKNAAEAGAVYASQHPADFTGIQNAVTNATGTAGITASPAPTTGSTSHCCLAIWCDT